MFGSIHKKFFSTPNDTSLTNPLVYLLVTVGFGAISSQDVAINIHFKTGYGNQWVVTHSYSMLKQLDSILCKSSKKLSYIAFPVLDKYKIKELYDVSQ